MLKTHSADLSVKTRPFRVARVAPRNSPTTRPMRLAVTAHAAAEALMSKSVMMTGSAAPITTMSKKAKKNEPPRFASRPFVQGHRGRRSRRARSVGIVVDIART
ncbi:unannotated protein [freshwater metagenome]|uniref:Unannotated protein n=1 Tax=freshwater metagenome TaxID=449393 RepID=A0A6J7NE67_9ZZZZ